MHVFADYWLADPKNWLTILQVALGLGFVIFVHELGHFAVAKLCGVKCEKFYLGFDIGGLKIWSFRRGETEYGIGILPLGGYVKMLGQDDNPARAAEEMERSRLAPPESVAGGDLPAEPTESTPPVHDPRSYLAQSVPERMAIISAGVIMNLIFAVIMAAIAYGIGVQELAATWVSEVVPGEAAWQADMRPGDRILSINGIENPRFRDLKIGVALADREDGVRFVLQRPGEEPREVVIRPDRDKSKGQLMPRIGIGPPLTLTLYAKNHPYFPRGPAGQTGQLKDRDKIVAVNGEPVEHHAELLAQLAHHPSETLVVEVERTADDGEDASDDATPANAQRLKVDVKPNPLKRLGLVMTMGKITAIQDNSPAAQAGFKPGDTIVSVDGEAPGDPLTLSERLRQKAGQTVVVEVAREGSKKPLAISAVPRDPAWYETTSEGGPYSAPALGIAFVVTSQVQDVIPGSPAAKQGIKPGAIVTRARFISPEDAELTDEETELLAKPVEFSDEKLNWPAFISALQWRLPGTRVELTFAEGTPVTVEPYNSDVWNPDRGFFLYPQFETRTAESVGEALSLGLHETKDLSLQVFRFLGALGTGRVSPKNLGGPGTIAVAAADSAQAGLPAFLIFLTMLSANLAVINFLPIPVLDGGHMVFLALEGIRGKPLSDRMVIWLTYLGFAFVLGLMIFVIGLDIEKLFN